jgi:hypothetical protein
LFQQDRPRLGCSGGGVEISVTATCGFRLLQHRVERLRVPDGREEVRVSCCEMSDLVGDRPSHGRRRRGPVTLRRHQGVELVPFGHQIG